MDQAQINSAIETGAFASSQTDPERFIRLALAFLQSRFIHNGRPTLAFWNDSFWHWTPTEPSSPTGAWAPVPDSHILAIFCSWYHTLPTCNIPYNIQTRSNLIALLQDHCPTYIPSIPHWRTNILEQLDPSLRLPWMTNPPVPDYCISWTNGLLDLHHMVTDSVPDEYFSPLHYLIQPGAEWFSPVSGTVPFLPDYNPSRDCPRWLSFLASTLDPADIILLQRYIGYCLMPTTDLQRALFLYGASASGKTTICHIIQALLGPTSMASSSIASLSGEFGLQSLIGRRILYLPDISSNVFCDVSTSSERIKSIISDDPLYVNRKGISPLPSHRFGAKVIMVSNDIPNLDNTGGAISRRILLIPFNRSFASKPDFNLLPTLMAELPGIGRWAFEGARALVTSRIHSPSSDPFPPSKSSTEAHAVLGRATNPTQSFALDCFLPSADAPFISNDLIYRLYLEWSKSHDLHTPIPKAKFLTQFGRLRLGLITRDSSPSRPYGRTGIALTSSGSSLFESLKIKSPLASDSET